MATCPEDNVEPGAGKEQYREQQDHEKTSGIFTDNKHGPDSDCRHQIAAAKMEREVIFEHHPPARSAQRIVVAGWRGFASLSLDGGSLH